MRLYPQPTESKSYEIPEVGRGLTSIFPFPPQWAATEFRCTTPLQTKASPADKRQPAIAADIKEAIITIHGMVGCPMPIIAKEFR